MGVLRWKKAYAETMPIPRLPLSEQCDPVCLVDKILVAKDADPDADVTGLESQIDRLVYDLYGLGGAEVAAVEGR